MKLRLEWLVAALAVSAVACGGKVKLEEVPAEFAPIICRVAIECWGAPIDQAACEEAWAAQMADQTVAQWQAAVEGGTLKYDAKKMRECLDAFDELGCGAFDQEEPPAACDEALQGTVATGGACGFDEECEGDAYCNSSEACPGTCEALLAEGDDCTSGRCGPYLQCGPDNKCIQSAKEGEACEGGTNPYCAGGLECDGGDYQTAGVCRAPTMPTRKKEGEPCDPQNEMLCESNLSCVVEGFDSTTGEITANCRAKVAAGAACKFAIPDQCPSGQYCSGVDIPTTLDGTCADLPGEGQDCVEGAFGSQCAVGLECNDSGKCIRLGRLGDSCSGDGDCASDFCKSGSCAVPEC